MPQGKPLFPCLLLLFALSFGTGSDAKAQALPQVPKAFQGYWALPNCEAPEIVYATFGGADLYYDLELEEVSLSLIMDTFDNQGWTVIVPETPQEFWMLRQEADGTLTDAFPIFPTDEERAANAKVWEPDPYNIDMSRIEISQDPLYPCDQLPAGFWALHGEGLAFFKAFDAASRSCGRGSDCLSALFSIFDVTRDGHLGRAELARAARMLGYAMVLRDDFLYTNQELAEGQGAGVVIGIAAAEILLRNFDYDDNAAISLDEFLHDRPQLRSQDFQLSFFLLRDGGGVGMTLLDGVDELGNILR